MACPNCKSNAYEMGYGMAGGGMGSYKICENCGEIYDKEQDPDAAVIHPSHETVGFETAKVVYILYTNHAGITADRRIIIKGVTWKNTPWHPEKQYIIDAWDCDKDAERSFALKSVHSWRFPE